MRKLLVLFAASSLLVTGCGTGAGTTAGGGATGALGILNDAQTLGSNISTLGAAYNALGNPNPTNDLISQAIGFAGQASQLSGLLGPMAGGNAALGSVTQALNLLGSFNGSSLLGSTNPLQRQQGFTSFLGNGQSLTNAATTALSAMM